MTCSKVFYNNVNVPLNHHHHELVSFLGVLVQPMGLVNGPYVVKGFYPLNLCLLDFIKFHQPSSRFLLMVKLLSAAYFS